YNDRADFILIATKALPEIDLPKLISPALHPQSSIAIIQNGIFIEKDFIPFQNLITTETFQVPDMTMPPMPNYLEKSFETMVKSYLLGIGHGWSFIGKDKHYWNLEFMLYKGIFVKHGMITNDLFNPKLNYQTSGGQFRLSYHF
ncbi:MAG: 2-dehydropantoate 2-reductase N-terminal domain-containing protein, partial [Crocinitomicaceae bacterium]